MLLEKTVSVVMLSIDGLSAGGENGYFRVQNSKKTGMHQFCPQPCCLRSLLPSWCIRLMVPVSVEKMDTSVRQAGKFGMNHLLTTVLLEKTASVLVWSFEGLGGG